MYLIQGTSAESHKQFKDRIFGLSNQLVKENKPVALKIVITENPKPSVSIIPFKKQKIASVSVWEKEKLPAELFLKTQGFSGVYAVSEELPVAYKKNWKDGEPTPGVNLLTLFRQKKGISYETFIDRWHNSHTPLSLKLYPLWNYSRNVVEEKLTSDSAHWDGIVEEHFRKKSDLLNPFTFFGKPFSIIPNMIEVYRDTKAFLDYKTIEAYLAIEYHIVSNENF